MSSPRKRQATRKSKPRFGRGAHRLLIAGGIGLGLVAALTILYLLLPGSHHPERHRVVNVPPQAPATAPTHGRPSGPAQTDAAPRKPRFDFYTMLPKLKVFVPEPREEVPDTPPSRGAEIDGQGTYALQVGSFRHLDDANRVKAKLALLGVEADIYTVRVNEQTWHRLRVGPYSNLQRLRDITARLRKNHINFMVLKIKG